MKVKDSQKQVRTRIAPSPTGLFHIGSARTALFNWLFARQNKGAFILRIEDTDTERSKPEYEQDIYESLQWLGLYWDEGPIANAQIQNSKFKIQNLGNYGPYRQSERKEIYKRYLQKLYDENKIYYCFCKEDELEAQKQEQMSLGQAPRYLGTCANISREDAEKKLESGKGAVLRFRMPATEKSFEDLIRGEIKFDTALFGDIVIAKDLKSPLYNLASVIDDYEMKISHIIRGEEHISNTPKQIIFAETLGFDLPKFGHLPLILSSDRSKMSKRFGAITIQEYREMGYLSEALVNFIALLGWHPRESKEIFSREELVSSFSLKRVQKAGAIFDKEKLLWMNSTYIKNATAQELLKLTTPFFKQYASSKNQDLIISAIEMNKNRSKTFKELAELSAFLFQENLSYSKDLLRWKKMSDEEILKYLDKSLEILQSVETGDWQKGKLEQALMSFADAESDRGKLLWPLRAALSGQKASPSPFEIAAALGKEKTLERIRRAQEKLK